MSQDKGAGAPEELYHAPAVCPPSEGEIQELSDQMRLNCSQEEVKTFHKEITKMLSTSYQRVAEMVAPSLPVKYPRTPGYRPTGEENKHNAWYYKCEIKGAASGKLAGKRVAIKDNTAVAGVPMMNGSKLMEGYVPEFDATIVTRILDAGGTIAGKANCEDLCYSGSSFTNATGPTTNPHDTSRTAGGSSSGSAVLVAIGEVDMATGGDQGGSVRIPASWCGVVGLKATFGLVPYTGAVGLEFCIDHLGPMARTVQDCALLLEVIAGYDGGRDTRQPPKITVPEYTKLLNGDVKGKRVGLVTEGFGLCTEDVQQCVRKAAHRLTTVGVIVEELSIPMHADLPLALEGHYNALKVGHASHITMPLSMEGIYDGLMHGNAMHILTPLDVDGIYDAVFLGNGNGYHWKGFYPLSMQEAFCRGYQSRPYDLPIMAKMWNVLGEYMRRKYQNRFYAKSQNLLLALTEAYNKALETYDVLVMPTLPHTATKLPKQNDTIEDILKVANDMCANTEPFNWSGHPALSINAGFSDELPVGMSIIGRHFDETSVLQMAYAFEQLPS